MSKIIFRESVTGSVRPANVSSTFTPVELLREQIVVALRSIRGNLLRTGLTVAIIGLGIMALISMTTATSSLEANVDQQFSSLGTHSFTIRQKVEGGFRRGMRVVRGEVITYRDCQRFAALAEEAEAEFEVAYNVYGSGTATLSRGSERTNPNIQILGVDENYLSISGYEVANGRNINDLDAESGAQVALIGADIAAELFEPWEDPVGSDFLIGSSRYVVVGVLAMRGRAFGMSQDNQCMIPIPCVRRQFSDDGRSYRLTCQVKDAQHVATQAEVATGLFRVIRGDRPGEDSSFEVNQANAMVETLGEATAGITLAATVIGLITLFGAGIGLMNIMLVSVAERTREIGTRKALGASPKAIRTQFLVEVIIIGQLGGIVGILLGLLVGNLVASFLETPFVVPWGWMILGVVLSFITSLASGYMPARQAAKLDPIVALGRE